MTKLSERRKRERVSLFYWSLGATAVSALFAFSGFYWFHSILMLVIGIGLGPIAALVMLVSGFFLFIDWLKFRK